MLFSFSCMRFKIKIRLGFKLRRTSNHTQMYLFENDLHPTPTTHGCNQEIPLWQQDEEECFPGTCKQKYMNPPNKLNIINWYQRTFARILTHIRRLKHKQELHCLIEYVHIRAVFDGLLSAAVLLPYHL
jgi:hypothetical protein